MKTLVQPNNAVINFYRGYSGGQTYTEHNNLRFIKLLITESVKDGNLLFLCIYDNRL